MNKIINLTKKEPMKDCIYEFHNFKIIYKPKGKRKGIFIEECKHCGIKIKYDNF